VEVEPGGSLTILPGTKLQTIPEGWLKVRGTIFINGTAGDSVRIVGADTTRVDAAGPLILDDASPNSRVHYLAASGVEVQGSDAQIDHASLLSISGTRGSMTLAECNIGSVTTYDTAGVQVTESTIQDLSTVFAHVQLENDHLREVYLSYSHADVRRCTFDQPLAYVLFHGASGGQFEQNNFLSATTTIEVRHTSNPVFTGNNFLSPTITVDLASYERPDCVQMTNNWWGTSSESDIRAKLSPNTLVCYSPWALGPIP
jgi:hypothetical protein